MTARETTPRLGRGLAALFGEGTAPPSIPDAAPRTVLPVASLEPGPFQPRMSIDPAALDDLVASIRQQGVRSHIANAIRLLQLPAGVRAHLRTGALSAGHARALLSHPEPETAAQAVIARGLNVRQTEALANGSARAADRGRRASRDSTGPETEAAARELTERLGLRVRIEFDGQGGSVRIDYRSLDQLDGLLALLKRD